ncbi:MAG: cysteine-rich repeat protein [Myxococcales bacterium]|nr:cysteine-rich repeat protein [Myxococcales bacterium]
MVRASWLLMVIAVATSCVTSNATDCGDGTTCPAGSQCDVDQGRCLRPEQLVACEGKDEQEECEIDGRLGVCRIGACELYFCGDGLVRNNEACDGVNLDGQTCSDRGFYADAGLACDTSCKFDESACGGGFCGDDIVNGSELCDGQTNKTCLSIGFDGGSVSCDESCGLTIRDCSRFGWNPEALNSVVALAVGGASALDHWAVGLSGRATRWEGAFWNAVPTHVTNNLIAVWGIAPDDVWVVGEGTSSANPAVLLWFNGTQWSTVTGTPAANFVDIWAAGPDAVYAATSGSGIQTWNGVSWSELGALNREAIAIRGSGPNDI